MTWWKVACTACAVAGAACVCVISAGTAAPFIAASAAPLFIGGAGIAGFFVGDKADKEAIEREKEMMKDKRFENAKNEVDKQDKENNQTESLTNEIVGKLNGTIPRKSHETDDYLKGELIIAQNKHKTGKERLSRLRGELDSLRKQLGGNQSLITLLGLDKLEFTDKVMIVGGIVLIIYLLKS